MKNLETMSKIEKFEALKRWYDEIVSDMEWQENYLHEKISDDENYDTSYSDRKISELKFQTEFLANSLNNMLK